MPRHRGIRHHPCRHGVVHGVLRARAPTSCSCASSASAPAVQRYHLGFMGCYAAMPALRTAKQFCEADAAAVVLVVSAELCTLHLRTSNDPDTIVASSLFADGAAAGIVTARPLAEGERAFDLDRFETRITPNGEGDMAWKIGDHGFEMVLSNAIPTIIDDHITGAIEPLLDHDPALAEALATDAASEAIEHWAIHPVVAASSTRWNRGCGSARRSSCRPARPCATTATCRARRCCSCCATSSSRMRPPTAIAWSPWPSDPASRSSRRS